MLDQYLHPRGQPAAKRARVAKALAEDLMGPLKEPPEHLDPPPWQGADYPYRTQAFKRWADARLHALLLMAPKGD